MPDGFRKLSDDEGYRGVFIDWIEEYSQFFQPCNWYTYHPCLIELEYDRSMGGVEMTFVILGIGFRIRYNFQVTETVADIQKSIADLKASSKQDV